MASIWSRGDREKKLCCLWQRVECDTSPPMGAVEQPEVAMRERVWNQWLRGKPEF
jgi:hypothetical protein